MKTWKPPAVPLLDIKFLFQKDSTYFLWAYIEERKIVQVIQFNLGVFQPQHYFYGKI